MTQADDRTCLVCGQHDPVNVRMRLSHWAEPLSDGTSYTTMPRCMDTKACQARCIAQGEDWPLEVTHDTDPTLLRVPRAQPEPPPAAPDPALADDVDQVDAWASFVGAGL